MPSSVKASLLRSENVTAGFSALLGLTLVLLGFSKPLSAATLRVAVASNFAPALRALQTDFETLSGHTLSLSPGSTGKHYAQILQGAPFAVFLAADAERPRLLEQQGVALEGTRFTYALGRLVLWSPLDAASEAGSDRFMKQLSAVPPPRLAIANPRLAPYGAAAESYLRSTGLWETLQPHIIMGENIGQAMQFVATGAAPMGLVALSQLRTLQFSEYELAADQYLLIDAALYPDIAQQAVQLQDSDAARAFLAWLKSEDVRARLLTFGYGIPDAQR